MKCTCDVDDLLGDVELEAEEQREMLAKEYHMPSWAYARSVGILVTKKLKEDPHGRALVSLRSTAGQALPLAFMSMFVLWVFYPCHMFMVRGVSHCRDEGADLALGVPAYPWWCWGSVLPVLAVCLSLQFFCMRYINLPKQQVLRGYTVLGCIKGKRIYTLFIMQSLMLSTLHMVDLASDSAFLGTILTSKHCRSGLALEHYWTITMGQSMFGLLLPAKFTPSLVLTTVFPWALNFLVLVFAFLEAMPVRSEMAKVDYEVALAENQPYKLEYATYSRYILGDETKQNHGAAMMIVAEASGMSGIVHKDEEYAFKKAQFALDDGKHECELEAMEHVESQARRSILRTLLGATLVNSSQLNIQVTILALSCAITHARPSKYPQLLLSIGVGAAMTAIRIVEACSIIKGLSPWYKVITDRLQQYPADSRYVDIVMTKAGLLSKWRIALMVTTSMCACWWLYAVIKLYMAFKCPSSLWNVTGCVHISHDEKDFLQELGATK